jgi:hypothetical protein
MALVETDFLSGLGAGLKFDLMTIPMARGAAGAGKVERPPRAGALAGADFFGEGLVFEAETGRFEDFLATGRPAPFIKVT